MPHPTVSQTLSPTRSATSAAAPAPAAATPLWRVELLGRVLAHRGELQLQRFPSRAVAALLARLAMAPERAHAREALVECLWPGVAPDVGRNRLRQALSTLKALLEPAGTPPRPVLRADRLHVQVLPGALGCDVLDFQRLADAGDAAAAQALYRGELMPGFYDEWIDEERRRLAARYEALRAASPAGRAGGGAAGATVAPQPPGSATTATDARAGVPAPDTTPPSPPGLPLFLTRLFGAEPAASRLRAALGHHRLVTLLGPGGSGKTRLAAEVAQTLYVPAAAVHADLARGLVADTGAFRQVAFVALAGCRDTAQAAQALARLLPPGRASDDPVAALAAAWGSASALLVLDNFEQLGDDAATWVQQLLRLLPGLHVLVTSRRALGVDGERCLGVEPLPLPAAGATLAELAANPAVALFADRARAARADFSLGQRNAAAVAALVRALQGLPLAIELAASRVRSLAPAEMAALLGGTPLQTQVGARPGSGVGGGGAVHSPQLTLLARRGRRAGDDPRHASMAEVVAWSWQLLPAAARQALQALVLFPVDAPAAAVAALLQQPVASTAAALDDAVAHSLLRAEPGEDTALRYAMPEPVREYAQRQLRPARARLLRARLRGWLLDWARSLGPAPAPAQVAPELPTVHAVLADAALAPAHAPSGAVAAREALALVQALRSHWDTDGLPSHRLPALAQTLQRLPASPEHAALRSGTHELLAYLHFQTGQPAEARLHAQAALDSAGADPALRARALVRAAWVQIAGQRSGGVAAADAAALQAMLDEALALARAAGDAGAQARALHQQVMLADLVNTDPARAEALLAQAQALWLQLGDRRKAYARLRNRIACWRRLGRVDDALATLQQCEQAAVDDGDWVGRIDTLLSLSSLLAGQRRWAEALAAERRGIRLAWERWHRHALAYALWNPPWLLARLRQPEPAMRLLAFAATHWQAHYGPLGAADLRTVRRVRGLVRAQLGAARAEALWIAGASMPLADAVALALGGPGADRPAA